MSAFKITDISTPDEYNSQAIKFELNSLLVPYAMQENFIIMEKIPDYLFHYITLIFFENQLQKNYELNKSVKSITNEITQITFDTNHNDFFETIKKILYTVEEHFPIIVKDLHNFDNQDSFLQKINKLNLFDKLNENLSDKKNHIKKIKI